MIKNKRELRSEIIKNLKELTDLKFELTYAEDVAGNGLKYFGYSIYFEELEERYYIMFGMAYAKKNYFKEGFVLNPKHVKNQCEGLVEYINYINE